DLSAVRIDHLSTDIEVALQCWMRLCANTASLVLPHGVHHHVCRTVNVTEFCETCWKLMRKVLGTHLGTAPSTTCVRIMEERVSREDAALLRGAVFFRGHGPLGAHRLPALKTAHPGGDLDILLGIIERLLQQIQTIGSAELKAIVYELLTTVEELYEQNGFPRLHEKILQPGGEVVPTRDRTPRTNRQLYEEELIEAVVLPQLSGIAEDRDLASKLYNLGEHPAASTSSSISHLHCTTRPRPSPPCPPAISACRRALRFSPYCYCDMGEPEKARRRWGGVEKKTTGSASPPAGGPASRIQATSSCSASSAASSPSARLPALRPRLQRPAAGPQDGDGLEGAEADPDQLPRTLQYKVLLLTSPAAWTSSAPKLCSMVTLGLTSERLKKTPDGFSRTDVQLAVVPVLTAITSYHNYLEPAPTGRPRPRHIDHTPDI
ncbi:unnamed protein product, partial [Gadus morhua 'NCC']